MIRKLLVIGVLLIAANTASALRVLQAVENSVELTLNELTLPAAAGGNVTFKACATCRISTHRVSAETKYSLNGHELALADFLNAVAQIHKIPNGAQQTFAGVYFDIASGRVTRIALQRRAP